MTVYRVVIKHVLSECSSEMFESVDFIDKAFAEQYLEDALASYERAPSDDCVYGYIWPISK